MRKYFQTFETVAGLSTYLRAHLSSLFTYSHLLAANIMYSNFYRVSVACALGTCGCRNPHAQGSKAQHHCLPVSDLVRQSSLNASFFDYKRVSQATAGGGEGTGRKGNYLEELECTMPLCDLVEEASFCKYMPLFNSICLK